MQSLNLDKSGGIRPGPTLHAYNWRGLLLGVAALALTPEADGLALIEQPTDEVQHTVRRPFSGLGTPAEQRRQLLAQQSVLERQVGLGPAKPSPLGAVQLGDVVANRV